MPVFRGRGGRVWLQRRFTPLPVVPLLGLWLIVTIAGLLTRPLLPVDETRYASVAWEMWQRGDFLVPYLNGAPYDHKPPLLFWLIHLGWGVSGVSEWWPRMINPLLSLAVLATTAWLARYLWPGINGVSRYASWILFGTVFWVGFSTWLQFDLLLTLCSLLGLTGVAIAWRDGSRGWWLTGLAIGMGILAKGPVVLVHVLPVALLAPLWMQNAASGCRWRWYGGVVLSVVTGALIALAWAIPAGQAGGEDYQQAIFWGQTAGRITDSFDHGRPWWWYLPWLFLLLAPWVLWPGLWNRLRRYREWDWNAGVRFCLAWLLPALVILSLISGKQVKYLLPLIPGFALLLGHWLVRVQGEGGMISHSGFIGFQVAVAGIVIALLPSILVEPLWLTGIGPAWGLALVFSALIFVITGRLYQEQTVILGTIASVLVISVLHLGVFRAAAPAYDLGQVSRLIASAQRDGRPVANLRPYHGQYHFLGRLQVPVEYVPEGEALQWAETRPDGRMLAYYRDWYGQLHGALWSQAYRGGGLAIWETALIRQHPDWLAHPSREHDR